MPDYYIDSYSYGNVNRKKVFSKMPATKTTLRPPLLLGQENMPYLSVCKKLLYLQWHILKNILTIVSDACTINGL
jgi:hypothetical protein